MSFCQIEQKFEDIYLGSDTESLMSGNESAPETMLSVNNDCHNKTERIDATVKNSENVANVLKSNSFKFGTKFKRK